MSLRWQGTHLMRPPTNNAMIRQHWAKRNGVTQEIKQAFWALALKHGSKAPRFPGRVFITVSVTSRTKKFADTDAAGLAVKAAIDGLKEARVIVDDTPRYVGAVLTLPPLHTTTDGLTLRVEEWDDTMTMFCMQRLHRTEEERTRALEELVRQAEETGTYG